MTRASDTARLLGAGGTFGGNIVLPNAGNIGSASDTDAIAISSGGVVTFTQNTVGAGGMDLLLDTTSTSSGGNIDISSTYINSTYDDYLLLFNLDPDTDDKNLAMQVFVGGTAQTGNIYGSETKFIGSSNSQNNTNAGGEFIFNQVGIGSDDGRGISGQLLLQNVNDTNHSFCYSGFMNLFSTAGNTTGNIVAGSLIAANKASVVNGLRFFMSQGQCVGDFKLYGLRT